MTQSRPVTTPPSTASLRTLLREDVATHGHEKLHPGLHALLLYRIGHWAHDRRSLAKRVVWKLYRVVSAVVVRGFYGTEISPAAQIGRRVLIAHHQAVTIPHCVIGDDCIVRHGVTLGMARHGEVDPPVVGRGVHFGPFSVVVGPLAIGDGAQIGPHSLVTTDVPAGATVFANPARTLRPS